MSTIAVFNGYGQYEQTNDGQKGITLSHGGVPFWFPFDAVTYLPDFTYREVDHNETTAKDGEEEGFLSYKTFRISGNRLAEELLEAQIPYQNKDMGIIVVSNEASKRKNSYVNVHAGFDDEGRKLMTEVQEIQPSEYEIAEAHSKALAYKEEIIKNYFQTKRERMSGGKGQLFPTGLIKVFMKELGVKDLDDVSKQLEVAAATPGISMEQLLLAVREIIAASRPAEVVAPAKNAPAQTSAKAPAKPESLV